MSTQLVLYPQNYEGYTSTFIANPQPEMMVDAIDFITVNASPTFEGSSVATSQIINDSLVHFNAQAGGIIPNSWYRVRNILGGGTPSDYPTEISNDLFIYDTNGWGSGIWQQVTNLTTPQIHEMTIQMTDVAPTTGKTLRMFQYGMPVQTGVGSYNSGVWYDIPNPSTTEVITFLPVGSNPIIGFYLEMDGVGTPVSVHINSISLKAAPLNPTGIYTDPEDGQVICDLYQEEDIPLALSIDDFKNVAEKVQSYSKDFSLPATKRNNRIFNNMFEITRVYDNLIFNPYVRTQCVLKQDGFIIFEGYLRLIDVKDKEGEISYNVNLYSDVIALADILKDRKFKNLNFFELQHTYNRTQIQNSWETSGLTYLYANTSGFRNADTIKYPFIDWTHQLEVMSNGNPELPNLETAFRPCIQLKYLIDRIFANTEFTYTSNFFNTTVAGGGTFDFDKLYMDFNWGNALAPNTNMGEGTGENKSITGNYAGTSYTRLKLDVETFSDAEELGYDNSTTKFTANRDNQVYYFKSHFVVEYSNTPSGYTTIGDMGWQKIDATGTPTGYIAGYKSMLAIGTGPALVLYDQTFQVTLNSGESLQAVFKKNDASYVVEQIPTDGMAYPPYQNETTVMTGTLDITTVALLRNLRGDLGQWEFLKGIFTMFNLVTLVDEDDPNNIIIEPYEDIFVNITHSGNINDQSLASRSIQHDWTDRVDVAEMELKPLTDLNKETVFQFVEDDDDYAFRVFKNANSGHLYGSEKIDQQDFSILDGTKEIIAEPFAATVSKPLMSQFNDFVVPSIYAKANDGTWEGFDNSPRILYNNGKRNLSTCEYKVPEQNGVGSATKSNFLQFSHLSTIPSLTGSIDFLFNSHQLASGVGTPPVDNLYQTYWSPYFQELYNADTRIMKLKVDLKPSDISLFRFTDTVMIKNRVFRVNKIEYKPNSLAKVEFILIG
jgi:hypothetical protein